MAANVEYKFPGHFEIDEEKLRRVYSIIKKRANNIGDDNILFSITRLDNLIYITENIDDIINESNDSISKITKIEIIHNTNKLKMSINFNHRDGSSIEVTGDDRDEVFLLSSELKEYISKEIANIKSWWWMNTRNIFSISIVIIALVMAYRFNSIKHLDDNELKTLLNSTDINAKLNHIINTINLTNSSATGVGILFGVVTLLIIVTFLPFDKITSYFFPKNNFLFGKQIEHIRKRRKTNSNIFWVVIVGGALSLALTLLGPKLL